MRLRLLFLSLFFSNVVVCVSPRGAMRRRASVSVAPLPAQPGGAGVDLTAFRVRRRAWRPHHDRRHEHLRRRHSISTPRGGRRSTVAPQPVLAEVDEQAVAFEHGLDLLRAYEAVRVAAGHVQGRGVQELLAAGKHYQETRDLGGLYRVHLELVRRRDQEEAARLRAARDRCKGCAIL